MSALESVASIVESHMPYPRVGGMMCHGCDWADWEDGGTHAEHVARLVLESVSRDERNAALQEAADDWMHGQWADAPRRPDRVQERIANAQYVGEWLKKRIKNIGQQSSGDEGKQ